MNKKLDLLLTIIMTPIVFISAIVVGVILGVFYVLAFPFDMVAKLWEKKNNEAE